MDQENSKITQLKGVENWSIWKFQIRVLMSASEVYQIATGAVIQPQLKENPTEAETSAFQKVLKNLIKSDGIAQKLIITSISEKVSLYIINCITAHEMWIKLHDIFESKNEASIHILQKQWFSLEKDQTDDISIHIAKIKDLAHRIELLGERISDNMIITKILMTLPSIYVHFISAWESTSANERTLENLIVRLSMEEIRNNAQDKQGNSALKSKLQNKGIFQKDQKVNKQETKCYKCGKKGHWQRECRTYIKGNYGNKKPFNKRYEDKGEALIGQDFAITISTDQGNLKEWYLDSGATQHMSPQRSWFTNFKNIEPHPLKVGNGQSIFAEGIGDILIRAFDGNNWNRKYLSDVLFVPQLKFNLFSLASALDKGLM